MSNITIVITCYLEGELINEAINSVLGQSVLPQEIIIVDGASTDQSTIAVCKQLVRKQDANCPIKVI